VNATRTRSWTGSIWKPLTDTATDRSKTIAANRDAALTELFVDVDTNANIAAPGR
jgi:hypothetical protein